MTLNLDKSAWKRVTLGDVAAASKERVDPESGEVERYVAGEHMDTDDLEIHRWGEVGDGYLGPAFHRRFYPGQVLYGSRRTYLRKVAVAEFDGVTANTTFVVETKDPGRLLQDFLPFVMTSEPFHAFAIKESKGSVNPYVNWSDIARYEFDLPPLDQQKRLAGLLWTVERHRRSVALRVSGAKEVLRASLPDLLLQKTTTDGEQVSIGEVAKVRHGFAFAGEYFSEDPGLPTVVTPGNFVIGGGFRITAPKTYAGQVDPAYVLEPGDLIVTMTDLSKAGDTLGFSAEVPDDGSVYLHNQRIGKIIMLDEKRLSARFLAWILRTAEYRRYILSTAAGSTVRHTSPARIEAFRLALPPLAAQTHAVATIERIERTSEAAINEVLASAALTAALSADIFGGGE
ncbi:restriction endonuclease subunit S [Micromonospora sp. NPDC005299]|uniref:restriction endonuclease subunit S n=1 Tax=Micromonospora sp. NPDC005299 TaxID=3364231 RepID=UPI0036C428FA